jgi:hypothetical protein
VDTFEVAWVQLLASVEAAVEAARAQPSDRGPWVQGRHGGQLSGDAVMVAAIR